MNRFTPFALLVAGSLALGGLAGCQDKDKDHHGSSKSSAKTGSKTLYERLGKEPSIRAVVHDFVGAAAADPKVNFTRKNPPHPRQWEPTPQNVKILEDRLVEFIVKASGGPDKYKGKSMADAHKGMEITDAEFNALAGHLVNSLKKFKVPQADIDALVKAVEGTRKDIVGK